MVRCWWTCEHRQTKSCLTSGQRRDLKQPDKTVSHSSKLFTSFVKGCARSVAKEETQRRPRLGCQEPVTLSIMQTDRLTTQPEAELNQLKHHNPIRKDNRHTRHIHFKRLCGIHVALFPQVITLITLEHGVCFVLSGIYDDFEWGKWFKLQC